MLVDAAIAFRLIDRGNHGGDSLQAEIRYRKPEANAAKSVSGAIACTTLWDSRFHDIRAFDPAGLAMLAGFFLLQPEPLAGCLRDNHGCIVISHDPAMGDEPTLE